MMAIRLRKSILQIGPLFDTFVKIFWQVRFVFSILLFLIFLARVSGQSDTAKLENDTLPDRFYILNKVERNGVVLPEVEIKEVTIRGRPDRSNRSAFRQYQRLIYNLKKAYPYAVIVRLKLGQVNEELLALPDDKERRRYLKDIEKEVFGEYEDDIRDLTITQGKLLIKLIDRETQNTSYELIKEYRGSFSAVFWQLIARIFGTDLKAEYDPYGEDMLIELIINEIEAGIL